MEIKLSSSAETSEPRPKPSAVMKTLETSAFQVFGVFRAKKVWETFLGCRMETRKRQKAQIFSLGAYLLGIKKDRNNGIDLW
ncbi:hypothetical protein [Streptococcus hyovaginalis]|uniref:hypothetical protein n=1 Tax=Streptococcus hyovaginalis TaxID=149015 RepID=UPI002A806997|nr:hypothetical protein [Streptococcus hyovaginalis]MDY4510612.1 hypothetical protein [Streptococcus hyovaginalis]